MKKNNTVITVILLIIIFAECIFLFKTNETQKDLLLEINIYGGYYNIINPKIETIDELETTNQQIEKAIRSMAYKSDNYDELEKVIEYFNKFATSSYYLKYLFIDTDDRPYNKRRGRKSISITFSQEKKNPYIEIK